MVRLHKQEPIELYVFFQQANVAYKTFGVLNFSLYFKEPCSTYFTREPTKTAKTLSQIYLDIQSESFNFNRKSDYVNKTRNLIKFS